MSRPILLAASNDKKENLAGAIKKQYNTTLARNDRRPEVGLWPGKHTFTNFYKANLLINGAPLITYSAADSLINTDSDIVTVGNEESHAIIKSMKNYFELNKHRRFKYAPPTNKMSETIEATVNELDMSRGEHFVFQAADAPFNNASWYAKLSVSQVYHVVAYLPSKQAIHQNPNNPSAQTINRVYQLPVRFNGEEHDCKEPNTWIVSNHQPLITNLDSFYDARKGTKTKLGTATKFFWNTLKAHPTKLPAMTRALSKAIRIGIETKRDGEIPHIPVEELQAAMYEVFDTRVAIRVAPGTIAEVFDVDSLDDYVLAPQLLQTHGHRHADAIENWKLDELPKLQEQHPHLRPANQEAMINDYLTTHGFKPLFLPSQPAGNSHHKKPQHQAEF